MKFNFVNDRQAKRKLVVLYYLSLLIFAIYPIKLNASCIIIKKIEKQIPTNVFLLKNQIDASDSSSIQNIQPLVELGFLPAIEKTDAEVEFRRFVYFDIGMTIITVIKLKNNKYSYQVFKTYSAPNTKSDNEKNFRSFSSFKNLGVTKNNRRIFMLKMRDSVSAIVNEKSIFNAFSIAKISELKPQSYLDSATNLLSQDNYVPTNGFVKIEIKQKGVAKNFFYYHTYSEHLINQNEDVRRYININKIFDRVIK